MARHTRWLKARPGRDTEILEVCLRQRGEDTFGRPLKTYSIEELQAMPAEQFAKVKVDGLLPNILLPHGPVGWNKDGVIYCRCDDCEAVRADWRKRTGRV